MLRTTGLWHLYSGNRGFSHRQSLLRSPEQFTLDLPTTWSAVLLDLALRSQRTRRSSGRFRQTPDCVTTEEPSFRSSIGVCGRLYSARHPAVYIHVLII